MWGRSEDDVVGHGLRLPLPALAPTLVRLTSSQVGVPEGEPLVLAAQVQTVAGDDPRSGVEPATGTVTFRIGGLLLGTAVLDEAGQAALGGILLPSGVHAIVASYAGDGRHQAASSAPVPQAVTARAQAVVVLVAAPEQAPDGVWLEAELVDPHTGRLAEDAAGSLVFSVGSRTLATAELVDGLARVLVGEVPAGVLRATFDGDTEHAAATGTA